MKSLRNKTQQSFCAAIMCASLYFLLMPVAPAAEISSPLLTSVSPATAIDANAQNECGMEDQLESRLNPGQDLSFPTAFTKPSFKKHSLKKHASKKRTRAARRIASQPLLKKALQAAWETWDVSADVVWFATDVPRLEDGYLQTALHESWQSEGAIDWRLEGFQLDTDAALEFQLSRWVMPIEIVGEFKKTDFSSLHSKLKKIRKNLTALQIEKKKPAPALVNRAVVLQKAKTQPPVEVAVAKKASPSIEPRGSQVLPKLASADFAAGISEAVISKLSQIASEPPPAAPVANVNENETEPVLEQAPDAATASVPSTQPNAPTALVTAPLPVLMPAQASLAPTQTLILAPKAETPRLTPIVAANNNKALAMNTQTTQRFAVAGMVTPPVPNNRTASILDDEAFGTDLQGRVPVENEVRDFLASRQATLEVFLVPISGSEKRDLIPVMNYPEEVFRFNAKKMKGQYRLVALALAKDNSEPIGRVSYEQEISAANAKQSIYFPIRLAPLLSGAIQEVGGRLTVPVTLSIFEGASSQAREPKPIVGAKVWVAGLPELGVFTSDSHGDVEDLPEFPIHSRLLFIVSHNDYLPTPEVVSIGTRDPEGRIFLVKKTTAETLSWMLPKPKEAVGPEVAVVMGRVYDKSSLQPLAGERVTLGEHDAANWAYFGPAADVHEPITQSEGFFSFFKVGGGAQVLKRLESGVRNFRLKTRPGYGYYVELGKMSSHWLQGLVENFFGKEPIAGAELQLVEDSTIYGTSNSGKFQIENIEFPAGRATIEFRKDGYPRTWHTAPFNPLDRMRPRKYAMLSNDEIHGILFQHGLPKWSHKAGMLVGKALGSLFELAQTDSLKVEVRTPGGKTVSVTSGPFPVNGSVPSIELTKQHPAFAYWNLPPGEFIVVFRRTSDNQIARVELVDTEADVVSVVY